MKCNIEGCDREAKVKIGEVYLCEKHWDMIYEVIAEILLSPSPFERVKKASPTITAVTLTEGDY